MVEPMDILDVGRMAVFAGPDGAVAGVWQARAHHGAGLVNEPGTWCWSQLLSPDRAVSMKFYRDVFGWTVRQHPEWGKYLALGEGEIAAVSQIGTDTPAEVPPYWEVVFMVADVDATLARARELGATVTSPAGDVGPGGRQAGLVDPQGAAFGVMSLVADG
jgi:predicted enzyme related to lactoylglutathione lyase